MNKNLFKTACLTGTALAISLIAAPTNAQQQNKLYKQLIGEWRNIYVKIVIPGKSGNKDATMEADSGNWEARIGIKPIRTHFKADGSYYSEYLNLKDSIVRKPTGTWALKGDTIVMTQLTPQKSETRLHVSITNNVATFNGMIDFDGDGKTNDTYFGKQRKF